MLFRSEELFCILYCLDGSINFKAVGETMISALEEEPVHYSGSEKDEVALICLPSIGTYIQPNSASIASFSTLLGIITLCLNPVQI